MSTALIAVRDTVRTILSDSLEKTIPNNQRILEVLKAKYPDIVSKATAELLDDGLQKLISEVFASKKRMRRDQSQPYLFSSVGEIIEIEGDGNRPVKLRAVQATLGELKKSVALRLKKKSKNSAEIELANLQIAEINRKIEIAGSEDLIMSEYLLRHPDS